MNAPYAVAEFYKDGTVFPVELNIATEAKANSLRSWMKIGQGDRQDWRVIPMSELRALQHAGRVTLSCFTAEAQAEKRALIEAAERVAP